MIIQASEILRTVHLRSDITKKPVLEVIYDSMNQLVNCHLIQAGLKREIEELIPICDALILEYQPSLFIKDFFQVKNLRNHFNEFFLLAKRFLQSHMRIREVCFGKPGNAVKFHKDIEWAEETFGLGDAIPRLLRDDNRWMFLIVSVRNYIEHPEEGLFVELLNFQHTIENKFTTPAWRYRLRNYQQDFLSDVCLDMENLCDNMLAFAEELFCLSVAKIWDPKWPFYIYRIADDRIDPQAYALCGRCGSWKTYS
jgi:hypothetical protein